MLSFVLIHNGQGVYRSSYKNALRFTRTEITRAYRQAEYERWQQLDFVVGFRVELSGAHPVEDICDELKGDYPKEFIFTGWHPQCLCYAVALMRGEHTAVKDVPQNFRDWEKRNADRIADAERRGTLPYFLRDNENLIRLRSNTYAESRNTGILDYSGYRRANSNENIIEDVISKSDKMVRQIEILPNAGRTAGNTDGLGTIRLRNDQMEAFLNAVDKMLNGVSGEITLDETGAVLTYWHEYTHNYPKALLSLAKIKGNERDVMEFATEFVAQKTIPEFYAKYGVSLPQKVKWASEHSASISNMDKIISKLGVKEGDVVSLVKKHIIDGEWEDQRTGLVNAIEGAIKNNIDEALSNEKKRLKNDKIDLSQIDLSRYGSIVKIDAKDANKCNVDKRKLNSIVEGIFQWQDFQVERKLNKLLGINQ